MRRTLSLFVASAMAVFGFGVSSMTTASAQSPTTQTVWTGTDTFSGSTYSTLNYAVNISVPESACSTAAETGDQVAFTLTNSGGRNWAAGWQYVSGQYLATVWSNGNVEATYGSLVPGSTLNLEIEVIYSSPSTYLDANFNSNGVEEMAGLTNMGSLTVALSGSESNSSTPYVGVQLSGLESSSTSFREGTDSPVPTQQFGAYEEVFGGAPGYSCDQWWGAGINQPADPSAYGSLDDTPLPTPYPNINGDMTVPSCIPPAAGDDGYYELSDPNGNVLQAGWRVNNGQLYVFAYSSASGYQYSAAPLLAGSNIEVGFLATNDNPDEIYTQVASNGNNSSTAGGQTLFTGPISITEESDQLDTESSPEFAETSWLDVYYNGVLQDGNQYSAFDDPSDTFSCGETSEINAGFKPSGGLTSAICSEGTNGRTGWQGGYVSQCQFQNAPDPINNPSVVSDWQGILNPPLGWGNYNGAGTQWELGAGISWLNEEEAAYALISWHATGTKQKIQLDLDGIYYTLFTINDGDFPIDVPFRLMNMGDFKWLFQAQNLENGSWYSPRQMTASGPQEVYVNLNPDFIERPAEASFIEAFQTTYAPGSSAITNAGNAQIATGDALEPGSTTQFLTFHHEVITKSAQYNLGTTILTPTPGQSGEG